MIQKSLIKTEIQLKLFYYKKVYLHQNVGAII